MTDRQVLEPGNPHLNVSRNFRLPHSPAIRGGGFIFVSGMVSIDPETGELNHGTMAQETKQILTNMKHLLESNGSALEKIVKTNVFIYDMLELENMNRAYRAFFPNDPPARTVAGAQMSGGLKVEIECVALE
jgi:2-iminobutanoate/2-iminopropanoate deaminase